MKVEIFLNFLYIPTYAISKVDNLIFKFMCFLYEKMRFIPPLYLPFGNPLT